MIRLLFLATTLGPSPEDWPQYNGPQHDRTASATLTGWSGDEPAADWRIPTATGFSSFVVADGTAYTLVRDRNTNGEREAVLAVDAATGERRWTRALGPADYDGGGGAGTRDNSGGDGPRSTPAVDGGRVYAFDAGFRLTCLDATTGEMVWMKSLSSQFDGRSLRWQNAACPVIDGDAVFVAGGGAGQSMLAFDKATGDLLWKTGDEKPTHATPVVATIHGTRQVIFYMQSGLVSLAPESGDTLWRAEFPYKISSAASPVVSGNLVYCSAGYGVGAGVFEVSKSGNDWTADLLWIKRNKLMNHWSTPLAHDGHLYGMFSFKKYGTGPLKCVDLRTGEERWSTDGYGPGNCIRVGDHLVALSDRGELVLVDATPEAYREVARADVLKGKCWSTPAYADGRVFVRSTSEAAAFHLTASGQ